MLSLVCVMVPLLTRLVIFAGIAFADSSCASSCDDVQSVHHVLETNAPVDATCDSSLISRVSVLERLVEEHGAALADLRARLAIAEAKVSSPATVHNSTKDAPFVTLVQPTDVLGYKFGELFHEVRRHRHVGKLPVGLVYLNLRVRDIPQSYRAHADRRQPGSTLATDVLASVLRDGRLALYGGGVQDAHVAGDVLPVCITTGNDICLHELCLEQNSCNIITAVGGSLPTAHIVTANANDASVMLWAVSMSTRPTSTPTVSAHTSEVQDEHAEVRFACAAKIPTGLPLSLLTWSSGVGDHRNQVFVGTSNGQVLRFLRNCTLLSTHTFNLDDGSPVFGPVSSIARYGNTLAAAVGEAVHFVHLDGHRELYSKCSGLGPALQNQSGSHRNGSGAVIVSLTFDATYPSLLWVGMEDGTAFLLKVRLVDPQYQSRPTCTIVRRLPPPVTCPVAVMQLPGVQPNLCSGVGNQLEIWASPRAAAIVSHRGSVIIGSVLCGLAVYNVSWSSSTAHVELNAASTAVISAAYLHEDLRCIPLPASRIDSLDSSGSSIFDTSPNNLVALRPAIIMNVGVAQAVNDRQRQGGQTAIQLVPLSFAMSLKPQGDSVATDWQLSTLALLPVSTIEPNLADSWGNLMGYARVPLILIGLVGGTLFQVWRRQRLRRERLEEHGVPQGKEGGSDNDMNLVKSLLEGLGQRGGPLGGALALHASAGTRASDSRVGSARPGASTAANTWIRGVLGAESDSGTRKSSKRDARPAQVTQSRGHVPGGLIDVSSNLRAAAQSDVRRAASSFPADSDDSDGAFGAM